MMWLIDWLDSILNRFGLNWMWMWIFFYWNNNRIAKNLLAGSGFRFFFVIFSTIFQRRMWNWLRTDLPMMINRHSRADFLHKKRKTILSSFVNIAGRNWKFEIENLKLKIFKKTKKKTKCFSFFSSWKAKLIPIQTKEKHTWLMTG